MIDIFADALQETLTQLVQLVVLCIPLIMLPMLIKNSSSIMGKIGNAADKGMRAMKFDKGLDAFRGGALSRANAYGRFGAKQAGQGLSESGFGQRIRGAPGAGRLGKAARKTRDAGRKARAYDQAILEANKARKGQKASDRETLAQTLAGGSDALKNFGGDKYADFIAGTKDKAFNERVSNIEAKFKLDGTSITDLGTTFAAAVNAGDHATATAATNRLAQMGAGGTEEISSQYRSLQGIDEGMQTTLMNAMSNNYESVVGKSGDAAKGSFDTNGDFNANFHGLGTKEVAKLSDKALERYADEIDTIRAVNPTDVRVVRAQQHFAALDAMPGGHNAQVNDPNAARELRRLQ